MDARAAGHLSRALRDARTRLLSLVADLSDAQLDVPQLPIVNLPLWELGHVAWFQERWMLRRTPGSAALRADADRLFDSAAVAHDRRWKQELSGRAGVLEYLEDVLAAALARLGAGASDEDLWFARLALAHEDMHGEALVYTRQTCGWSAPRTDGAPAGGCGPLPGDVEVAGGSFRLGARPGLPFVFDNELQEHAVRIAPFRIARACVTQAEFAQFTEDGGYQGERCWDAPGARWKAQVNAQHPLYWRREASGRWLRRHYDRWMPLEEHQPVLHVCWHEAQAFCRWARRRLPSEAEWEFAASHDPRTGVKRLHPWGEGAPDAARAQLDLAADGPCDVGARPQGDSAWGCRQMLGNVWEWCADAFQPYPGFTPGPYREYSQPWFGTHKVLRGGCFATRARLLRNSWRNFYPPDRRDVLAGFRTCAS